MVFKNHNDSVERRNQRVGTIALINGRLISATKKKRTITK